MLGRDRLGSLHEQCGATDRPRVERPELLTHVPDVLPMLLVRRQHLVHQPLGMDPAQCVLQNVEPAGIAAHAHRIVTDAVGSHCRAAPLLGGYAEYTSTITASAEDDNAISIGDFIPFHNANATVSVVVPVSGNTFAIVDTCRSFPCETGECLYRAGDFRDAGYEGQILPGMTICVESCIGEEGRHEGVKLEQQLLVTDTGTEVLSRFPFEDGLGA